MAELVVNEQNFQSEVANSATPVMLDFWAPWCGPCKMLTPVVDALAAANEGKLKVGKVNTDENMNLSAKFQITSIPCLVFFKGGKAVERIVGFRSQAELQKAIDRILG